MRREHYVRFTLAVVALAYLVGAYLLVPRLWERVESKPGAATRPYVTRTSADIPGDPINIGLVGSRDGVIRAMTAAGWKPADSVTLRSSLKIGASVAFRRPYPTAPVSPLFYDGRKQDLAFERESGRSASHRHHVRFWFVTDANPWCDGIWLGAATYDAAVGLSHDTGQITHHIDPDVDAERAFVLRTLGDAGRLKSTGDRPGSGATETGRNGGGDPYRTDGMIAIGVLNGQTAECR